jgi:hypothetical protein
LRGLHREAFRFKAAREKRDDARLVIDDKDPHPLSQPTISEMTAK